MLAMYGFSELTCTELYPKYLEFRHSVFNKVLKYNESGNPVYDLRSFKENNADAAIDVEYDHYDTPKALHLALVQISNLQAQKPPLPADLGRMDVNSIRILGCLRFLPTDGPYMIKDNIAHGAWKNVGHLLKKLPSQSDIYEASRIAVAPFLRRDDALREIVLDNLVYANVEIGARLGIRKMIGIMYDRVWESVYRKRGVPVSYISDPFHVDDGQPIIVGEIDVSEEVLCRLRKRYAFELLQNVIKQPHIASGTLLTHQSRIQRSLPEQLQLSSLQPEINFSAVG